MTDCVLLVFRDKVAGLSAMRVLGAKGYAVDAVVASSREGSSRVISKSRFARRVVDVALSEDASSDDATLAALLEYAMGPVEQKTLIVPCDRYAFRVVCQNQEKLSPLFVMPFSGSGFDLKQIADGSFQRKIAQKVGAPLRWAQDVPLSDYQMVLPEISYPCRCSSDDFFHDRGERQVVFETEERLERSLKRMASREANRTVTLSEVSNSEKSVVLYGLCLGSRVYARCAIESVGRERGFEKAGAVRVVSSVEGYEQLVGVFEMVMRELDFYGPCSVRFDVLEDGRTVFDRVIPWTSVVESAVDDRIPSSLAEFADYMLRGDLPSACRDDSFCGVVVNENTIWKEYCQGCVSRKTVKRVLLEADAKIIEDAGDLGPYEAFIEGVEFENRARKRIKRAVGKRLDHVIRAGKPLLRRIYHVVARYPQTKKKNERHCSNQRPRVIVAGRAYNSNLFMVRSLGEAGYDVEVLRVFIRRPRRRSLMRSLKPDAYSKYVKAYRVCVSGRRDMRVVRALLKMADPDNKMLVVPVDDFVANVVDRYYDLLSEYFILPNIKEEQGELAYLMSKSVQKELARKAGLPVVNSCVIRSEGGSFSVPDDVSYPCFVKPNMSKNSYKTRMQRCNSKEELVDLLSGYAERQDFEMLVEDYIEVDREYSLLGLSVREGVLCPGLFGVEMGGQKEHRGVALLGRVLSVEQYQGLVDSIADFVRSLEYDGLFDVDLIGSVDGEMYFVELNLRFGGSGYAITRSGLNLPGMYADYKLRGKPIDFDLRVLDFGKVFVNERILVDEYVGGRITASEAKRLMAEADICFMKSDEDAPSYRHFKRYAPIAVATRAIRARRRRMELEPPQAKD